MGRQQYSLSSLPRLNIYGSTMAEKKRRCVRRAALGIPVVPDVKMWTSVSVVRHVARTLASGGRAVVGNRNGSAHAGVSAASTHTKSSAGQGAVVGETCPCL